jgi:hypothetical protein
MQMIIQFGLVFLCDHLDKNLFVVGRNKIAFAGAVGHIAFSFFLDVIRGLRCLSFPKKNDFSFSFSPSKSDSNIAETRDERWSAIGSVIYAFRMAQMICVCTYLYFSALALCFICPRVPAACVLVESDVDQ